MQKEEEKGPNNSSRATFEKIDPSLSENSSFNRLSSTLLVSPDKKNFNLVGKPAKLKRQLSAEKRTSEPLNPLADSFMAHHVDNFRESQIGKEGQSANLDDT